MSFLFSSDKPLLVCLTPGVLPNTPGYRIARPLSPAGLGSYPSPPEGLLRWIERATERRLIVRFDGKAFFLWGQTFHDIAKVETNWEALCKHWKLPTPPEKTEPFEPEDSIAGCYQAWRATKHLTAPKKSTAEKEEESRDQADFMAPPSGIPNLPEDTPLCFVDVETTGGSPANGARVVQIALARLYPTTGEVETFSSLVNPEGRESEYGAWKVHQLSKWTLAKAPYFTRLLPRIWPLLEGAIFVAHNAAVCDEPFVRSELGRVGREWPCLATIDTLKVARKVFDHMKAAAKKEERSFSFSLGALAGLLVVEQGRAHDATGDVQTLLGLWHAIRERNPKLTLTDYARM